MLHTLSKNYTRNVTGYIHHTSLWVQTCSFACTSNRYFITWIWIIQSICAIWCRGRFLEFRLRIRQNIWCWERFLEFLQRSTVLYQWTGCIWWRDVVTFAYNVLNLFIVLKVSPFNGWPVWFVLSLNMSLWDCRRFLHLHSTLFWVRRYPASFSSFVTFFHTSFFFFRGFSISCSLSL